jgi:hypothetical protein
VLKGDLEEANTLITQYEELEDESCSCHISAPCYKCENQPTEELYKEALNRLHGE